MLNLQTVKKWVTWISSSPESLESPGIGFGIAPSLLQVCKFSKLWSVPYFRKLLQIIESLSLLAFSHGWHTEVQQSALLPYSYKPQLYILKLNDRIYSCSDARLVACSCSDAHGPLSSSLSSFKLDSLRTCKEMANLVVRCVRSYRQWILDKSFYKWMSC